MASKRRVQSSDVAIPGFRALMEGLSGACEALGVDFFVIGALARDLHLEHVHGIAARRRTQDVDAAAALGSWRAYERLRGRLTGNYGFRETDEKQRLVSPDRARLDLVPFGGLEAEGYTIQWPPDGVVAMSTLGLAQAQEAADRFVLDGDLSFPVASLSGLAVLKLIAWEGKPYDRAHDAQDLCFIVQSYYDVQAEAVYDAHFDLFESEEFDKDFASARVLGRDVAALLERSDALRKKVVGIPQRETTDQAASRLADAMRSPHLVSHKRRFQSLEFFLQGILERLT